MMLQRVVARRNIQARKMMKTVYLQGHVFPPKYMWSCNLSRKASYFLGHLTILRSYLYHIQQLDVISYFYYVVMTSTAQRGKEKKASSHKNVVKIKH